MQEEVALDCPHCGAPITVLVDCSVSGQQYIEDCEVCCRPMATRYEAEGGVLCAFDVQPSE